MVIRDNKEMNKFEAEKIVNAYGGVIANTRGPFRKISGLPHPKAIIKQAYFVYIEAIIKDCRTLPKGMGEALVATYSMLDGFLDDEEVKNLNELGGLIREKSKSIDISEQRINEYCDKTIRALNSPQLLDEINDFIGACYDKYKDGNR